MEMGKPNGDMNREFAKLVAWTALEMVCGALRLAAEDLRSGGDGDAADSLLGVALSLADSRDKKVIDVVNMVFSQAGVPC